MPAIRTVAETDDVHVIEGLGIPFGGPFPGNSDSYRTRAKAKTDFHWDLFPDRAPSDPPETPARFIRPVTFSHGFDEEIGLRRIGGWSPVRIDKKGVWVQAQIDKHDEYYDALRDLLGADKLGFSSGSVEHAVRFDDKNGDWLDWPAWDMALTPIPSNPWAQIATRTAAFSKALVRITGLRATDKSGKAVGPPEGGKERDQIPAEDFGDPENKSYPIVNQASVDDAAALIGKAGPGVKERIIAIAKRKGLDIPEAWKAEPRSAYRTAADDVGWATHIQGDLAFLMGCEAGEADQLAKLQTAFDAITEFIALESKEIGEGEEPAEMMAPMWPPAYMSAHREGRRNSGPDLEHIDAIHDHTVALGASAHAGSMSPDDESHQGGDALSDTPARSAGALPKVRISGLERADAKTLRALLKVVDG